MAASHPVQEKPAENVRLPDGNHGVAPVFSWAAGPAVRFIPQGARVAGGRRVQGMPQLFIAALPDVCLTGALDGGAKAGKSDVGVHAGGCAVLWQRRGSGVVVMRCR